MQNKSKQKNETKTNGQAPVANEQSTIVPLISILKSIKDSEESLSANEAAQPNTTFTGKELYDLQIPAIPFLIDPLIPAVGLWSLVGTSDACKSMFMRQLAICLVKQKPFLNWKINSKFHKAIFVSTEDDEKATAYLLRKQSASGEFLENIRFYFSNDNVEEYLKTELTKEPADLVIIDAWGDVFGQDLKDSNLIRQALNIYRLISYQFQCSVGILHHVGKRTEKLEPSKNNILAGQGFESKCRSVMELRQDAGKEDVRHLCIVKGNYVGREYKNSSFVLDFNRDNFLLTDTGERTPFEQLITQNETGKTKPNTPFNEFNDDVHRELVKKAFRDNHEFTLTPLSEALCFEYEVKTREVFGRRRIRGLIEFLEDKKFITCKGKEKARKYLINV